MIKNTLPETSLTLSDFDYDLPESRIAQTPLEPRDSSRLMIIDRTSDQLEHRIFRDIVDYLRPGDTLVVNDTRVIPARIIGHRAKKMMPDGTLADTESTAPVELLLLKQRENDVWEALAGPGKRAKVGDILAFGDGFLTAEVEDVIDGGCRVVRFRVDRAVCETVYEALHKLGSMPLPPYITEHLENPERYQTVYARHEGSAAAPTAGLHFTPELMERIREMGWHLLLNENHSIVRGEDKLSVIGVENISGNRSFRTYGNFQQARIGADGAYKILLSHDPSHWRAEVVGKSDVDLTLSGHTHAMQISLLGWSPSSLMYDEYRGLYNQGEQYLYVNTGLGQTAVNARFGATPEITLITLKTK